MPKKKNKTKLSTPTTRMDDACFSHDPLTQFINRSRYHDTYIADVQATSSLRVKIQEEEAI